MALSFLVSLIPGTFFLALNVARFVQLCRGVSRVRSLYPPLGWLFPTVFVYNAHWSPITPMLMAFAELLVYGSALVFRQNQKQD